MAAETVTKSVFSKHFMRVDHSRHLVTLLLLLFFNSYPLQTAAWKDEGHMLVAAVARQYMRASTVEKVENALQLWKNLYPSTSTLESSAVWMDHVQCTSPGAYCSDFLRLDALSLFRGMHYTSNTWNPQNISMRIVDKALPHPNTGSKWALQEIYHTLLRCTATSGEISEQVHLANAKKAANLARQYGRNIVQKLHGSTGSSKQQQTRAPAAESLSPAASSESTVGRSRKDSRRQSKAVQPSNSSKQAFVAVRDSELKTAPEFTEVHAEAGSTDALPLGGICSVLTFSLYIRMLIHIFGDAHQPLHNSEVFSRVFTSGDRGGNKVFLTLPPSHSSSKFEDPHERTTSNTGGYTRTLHGEWDSVFGQYETYFYKMDPKTLKNNAQRLVHLYPMDDLAVKTFDDMNHIVQESFAVVQKFVYSEFDWGTFTYKSLPYKPTVSYIEKAKQVGDSRIALAGARLALLLESLAPSLPQIFAAAPSPVAKAWLSPLASQPGTPTSEKQSSITSSTASATSPLQRRSSTRQTTESSLPAASSTERRSSTRDSSSRRSSTRDSSSSRRDSTRDSSSSRRSGTRDSSSSRVDSINGADDPFQDTSEFPPLSKQIQKPRNEKRKTQSASGSASFILQRAHASVPFSVKKDEGEGRDENSSFANAVSTAKEHPSMAAAGIVVLVLMLVLMAVQVWLYRKVQLYKRAMHVLLSRDSGAITHTAVHAAATEGTPDTAVKLLAEHENREKEKMLRRCVTEDDDASTSYASDSSLLHY